VPAGVHSRGGCSAAWMRVRPVGRRTRGAAPVRRHREPAPASRRSSAPMARARSQVWTNRSPIGSPGPSLPGISPSGSVTTRSMAPGAPNACSAAARTVVHPCTRSSTSTSMSPLAPSAFGTKRCDLVACSTSWVTVHSGQFVGAVQSPTPTLVNRRSKPSATAHHIASASVTSTPPRGVSPPILFTRGS
jgi:hypothetical protein